MSSMLHRSFKPAKCKTALKLAVSRIKLLKNKREAQVRQLKRELAQLLESGQDQTARIRVEHVVREEKTMAAYDLIEIYCELIAARLPMIESQKNCPIDLKEAISSVIFACPRCADLPELVDVRKHLTVKYGKEFASAAVELRPDCGVNRLLVEKLSAKAPDGPTKIKILSAIAEEHNIKWEPKSFGENDVKPSQDLLAGPNTFEKATYAEPSQVHVPAAVRDEKGPPNVQASSQFKPVYDRPTGSDAQNTSDATRKDTGNQSRPSGMSDPKIMPSGTGNQEMHYRDSYSENRSAFPTVKQNWNMEFKDAASAAQAAAESAERASMAARAAAELSSRENVARQRSSESHSSPRSQLRDEVPQEYSFNDDKHLSTGSAYTTFQRGSSGMNNEKINTREQNNSVGMRNEYYRNNQENVTKHVQSASLTSASAFDDEHLSTNSAYSTFHRSSSGMKNEKNSARDQDNMGGAPNEYYRNSQENAMKHVQSASLSSASAFDDNPFASRSQMADINQHHSFEQGSSDFRDVRTKRQESRTEADFVTKLHGDSDVNTEDNYDFGDASTDRKSRQASSSHLISPSDDRNDSLNLSGWGRVSEDVEDRFVTGEGNTMETSSYKDTSVVFDNYGSEDDDYKFEFDEKPNTVFFPSPDSKSHTDSLEKRNSWSHGQDINEEVPIYSSQSKEDMLPVTFDDYDDSDSDSEVNSVNSKVPGNFGYVNSGVDHSTKLGALEGSSSRTDKTAGSDRNPRLLSPSSFGSDTLEEHFERKVDIASVSGKNFGNNDSPTSQPSSRERSSVLDSDLKANIHASQSPNTSIDTESFQESEIGSARELNYGTLRGGFRNKGYSRPPYVKGTLNRVQSPPDDMSIQNERSLPTVRTLVSSDSREASTRNRSVGLRTQSTFSESDNFELSSNSQQPLTSTYEPRIRMGQSETKKKSKTYFDSDDSSSDDEQPKQNLASSARPGSGASRRTSVPSKTATTRTKLGWKSTRASQESENEEASSMNSSENRASSEPRSSTSVQPSSSLPKKVMQDYGEEQEASKGGSSEADTKEKAGHVHPKLPDYDSFAAHFMSLRKGRQ
ncbi:hypothetical protein HN51_008521 [Arachis hypogaea]|uniref:Uncharacterized protein LOC107490152 n=1 Tax=Arachis duranensis TaxID=130453 RepID=A0A6P4DI06_ARADU|nr:uncharacterized protein LOC107490152 [Arachis duranensis]XP_025700811.1 sericin 1 [Arachis hypogaea]QHO42841.1 IST1-like protein [Arachis hypogaea]